MILSLLEFTTDNILDVAVATYLKVSPYKEGKPPIPDITQTPIPTDDPPEQKGMGPSYRP